MNWRTMLGLLAGLLLTASITTADVVTLHDGRVVKGKITSDAGAPVVKIETTMGPLQFPMTMVKSIATGDEPAPSPSPSPSPADAPSVDAPPADTPPPASQPDPLVSGPIDPAVLAKLNETRQATAKAATGAEGLAAWDAFLAICKTGSLADRARQEQVIWKDRADKNLVRFGPNQWLAKDQVDARVAKANELVTQAEAAADDNEAGRLFDQAIASNPYLIDIPLKKAAHFHKAHNLPKYSVALADVLKVDPNNVMARNNLGVNYAVQRQWAMAIGQLARAAANSLDDETSLNNLDQVAALIADDDDAPDSLEAEADRAIRSVVEKLHAAKQHVGETRWGTKWISDKEYKDNLAKCAEINKKIAEYKRIGSKLQDDYEDAQRDKKRWEKELKDLNSANTARSLWALVNFSALTHEQGQLATRIQQQYPNYTNAPAPPANFPKTGGGVIGNSSVLSGQQLIDAKEKARKRINDANDRLKEDPAKAKELKDKIRQAKDSRPQRDHIGDLVLLDADGKTKLDSLKPEPPKTKDKDKGKD